MTMIAYAFLQSRRLKQAKGKKESLARRPNRAYPPSAKPSSSRSRSRPQSVVPTAAEHLRSKSAKVLLEPLDLTGAAAYDGGIHTNRARPASYLSRAVHAECGPRRYAFQLAPSRRRSRRHLDRAFSAAGIFRSACFSCVVAAELTRLKVMAPRVRIFGPKVRAHTTHGSSGSR